jgi:ADP-heptose:LPS heptosyltransferase
MKILIIQGRGLGDAIITRNLLEKCLELEERVEVDFLCSFHNEEIFTGYKKFPIKFPVNIKLIEVLKSVPQYIFTLFKLNLNRYEMVIDPVGGAQENLFLRLIYAKKKISAKGNPSNPIYIMANKNTAAIGQSYYYFLLTFFSKIFHKTTTPFITKRVAQKAKYRIGISPSGGVGSRTLTPEQITYMTRFLSRTKSYDIIVYTDKNNYNQLYTLLKEYNVKVSCNSVKNFLNDIKTLDLFIGTDSFGVHAANFMGVQSIFINSSNDARLWAPPGSIVIDQKNCSCSHKPCFNNIQCLGSDKEYVCIKEIDINIVIDQVNSFLKCST